MELQVRQHPEDPGDWLVLRTTSSNLEPGFESRVNEQGQSIVATHETIGSFASEREAQAYKLGIESGYAATPSSPGDGDLSARRVLDSAAVTLARTIATLNTRVEDNRDFESLYAKARELARLVLREEDGPPAASSPRRFYRTHYAFRVLSQKPIPQDLELFQVLHECVEASYVLEARDYMQQERLSGREAADALYGAASEPGFFGLDDEGQDVEL